MHIESLLLTQLQASPTNPRKRFDPDKLAELAADIGNAGILQPITVRLLPNALSFAEAPFYEIVCGERRFRAAGLAGCSVVPCIVQEFTDQQVLERQMVENLQRDDLDPLEEAEGYQQMLALRGDDGQPVYTLESLAGKIGKGHLYVRRRLWLRDLPGTVKEALLNGRIGARVAELIARIPSAQVREEAAGKILRPEFGSGDPLTVKAAASLIQRDYMRQLKGAPFSQTDPTLNPTLGPCGTCPHRASNAPELYADERLFDVCTLPPCYSQKTEVTWARAQQAAKEDGHRVLTEAENREVFMGSEMSWNTHFVRVNEQPKKDEVRPGTKQIPSWKKLVTGAAAVEIVIGRDWNGRAVELVDRRLAVEAARKNGHADLFPVRGSQREQNEANRAAEAAVERERAKFVLRVKQEWMADFVGRVNRENVNVKNEGTTYDSDFWTACLPLAIAHAGSDGCRFVVKRRGIPHEGKELPADAIRRHAASLDEEDRAGLVMEVFMSEFICYSHVHDVSEAVRPLLAFFGVDMEAAERRANADPKKAGKKAAAETPLTVAEVTPPEKPPTAPAPEPVGPSAEATPVKARAGAAKKKLKKAPGELGKNILAALEYAGAAGLTIKDLTIQLGVKAVPLYEWFHSKGAQKNERLRKIGPAKYQLLPAAAPEVAAA